MNRREPQTGFSIVSALFLLVVLSSLAAYMVSVGGVQRATTLFSIQGARVYHASRSGIEWGVRQALVEGNCGTSELALGPYAIEVSCELSSTHSEKGANVSVYLISSQAEFGEFGDREYISRTLDVTVSEEPL